MQNDVQVKSSPALKVWSHKGCTGLQKWKTGKNLKSIIQCWFCTDFTKSLELFKSKSDIAKSDLILKFQPRGDFSILMHSQFTDSDLRNRQIYEEVFMQILWYNKNDLVKFI